jgi:RNA polymerase sigma-70 factor (ECF subfamily)
VQTQRGHEGEVRPALLRGLRAGSSQAWAALYDQLAPGIHRFAVSCLSGDAETAEEVVVETLAQAASGIARFDPQKSSLSAWIYGIARRQVQAELRWCRRRKSVPAWAQVSFEDLSELTDSHDPAERTAARLDAQRRVEELTGLLSDTETEVLELSAVEELSREEIGRVVGRSQQAARSLLKRAKQKVRRTAIEGTLIVGTGRAAGKPWGEGDYRHCVHLFSGLEDRLTGDELGGDCDLSPVSDEVTYNLRHPLVLGRQYYPWPNHIWKAKRDGSEAVNLTETAGLGGINLGPRWSPDGTMIAFVRWELPEHPRQRSGEVWVVKADGSEARRVAPKEVAPVCQSFTWSPEGLCLSGWHPEPAVEDALPGSVDLWGRRVRVVRIVAGDAEWSPDGTRVARTRRERGHSEGEPGYWNRLLVMEADGSRPRVLVEQFIADAQLDAYHPAQYEIDAGPDYDARYGARAWAGPFMPTWSPGGDKIAFLAGLPFDPERMVHKLHVDAWVYDLVTRRLTKITNRPWFHNYLSWR